MPQHVVCFTHSVKHACGFPMPWLCTRARISTPRGVVSFRVQEDTEVPRPACSAIRQRSACVGSPFPRAPEREGHAPRQGPSTVGATAELACVGARATRRPPRRSCTTSRTFCTARPAPPPPRLSAMLSMRAGLSEATPRRGPGCAHPPSSATQLRDIHTRRGPRGQAVGRVPIAGSRGRTPFGGDPGAMAPARRLEVPPGIRARDSSPGSQRMSSTVEDGLHRVREPNSFPAEA